MNVKYLSVQEAAKRAGQGEFLQNVKEAVIPRLIKKGLLHGKQEKQRQLVADDQALARMMRFGVESFVWNQQGYSFMAVRAPIQVVASKLKARPGVAQYHESVKVAKMKDNLGVQPEEKVRQTFLVQMRDAAEWSLLIQTVHWFHSCDSVMGTALACALSRELHTLAAAAWDDDFSGSSLIVCENGKQKAAISDEGEGNGWEGYYEFFYEQGIYLPKLFISGANGSATLHAADPAEVQRTDHVVLKVPRPVESKGARVFEKLGVMAEAIEEGLDDEEAFMEHMLHGVWSQAEAVVKSGKF